MYVYIHVGWFQVNIMDMLYQEGKAAPPLFKNQPPVAGSIFWERSLFLRMKNTIIKFLTMDEMMLTERGKAVSISLSSLTNQSICLAQYDDWTCRVSWYIFSGTLWWVSLLDMCISYYVHYIKTHSLVCCSIQAVLGSYRATVTQVLCIYMYEFIWSKFCDINQLRIGEFYRSS